MNHFTKGAILLLLSALGFAFLPIFALYAYKGGISILTLLFFRFILAALLLFIYVFYKYRTIRVELKDLIYLLILGGVGYNLQSQFYFSSVKYIQPSLAALFLYTYPMFVTFLSFFVEKEKSAKAIWLSVGISFSGLILILGTSVQIANVRGILLALGAAVVYSFYITLSNRVVKRAPPLVMSAFIALFASIGVLGVGWATHGISLQFNTGVWFPIMGLALFSTVIAILFFFRGMELLGPARASVISMMEPVFTVVLSIALLGDRLSLLQLAGGLLVLIGALWVVRSREPEKSHQVEAS